MAKLSAPKKVEEKKKKKERLILNGLFMLFSIGSIGLILGVSIFLISLYHFGQDLPDYKQLKEYQPPITTRLYAADGKMIAEYATEKRVFVPVYAIPKPVIYAFLSAEDKNFFSHKGVDFYGVLRAVIKNLQNISSGKRLEGASTITQQVAKNFLLTNETSFERKIKEAILAFRMEKTFTKSHLLELYLNEIYLGNRSFGVAAASLNYFDKSLNEMSLEEVALLAALPKAPSAFDPYRNPERAKERRDWVLQRMYEDGRVTKAQMEKAQEQPIKLQNRYREDFMAARYFTEEVRRDLVKNYGDDVLYLGGLSVRTTLDPHLQKVAVNALRNGLEAYDRRHGYRGAVGKIENMKDWQEELKKIPFPLGARETWRLAVVLKSTDSKLVIGMNDGAEGEIPLADLGWARRANKKTITGGAISSATQVASVGEVILVFKAKEDKKDKEYYLRQIPSVEGGIVALDPHTGRVIALHGGYSADISSFNRVTQAKRQPGSAFKPFIYLAALDEGFTPANIILDAPFVYDQGPGLPKWRPTNYTKEFYGPTPLRVGIEKSKNLMTVRLAYHIGMEKVAEYAKKFGVIDNLQPHLAMSLGAGETTLMRMASAYAIFANGGKKVVPSLVDRIQDRNGKTIYKSDVRECKNCNLLIDWQQQEVPIIPDDKEQIADPRTNYQMVSMLEGVIQRGTAMKMKSLNRPIAGKTGTTNESKDTWFMAFTPNLVVGTYVGFDDPRSLGRTETGSSVALPIVKEFMEEALKDQPAIPFKVPEGLSLVKVDRLTGRPARAGNENVIWEAFIPGTEPSNQQYMLDEGGLNQVDGETGVLTEKDTTSVKESATTGTGGLY